MLCALQHNLLLAEQNQILTRDQDPGGKNMSLFIRLISYIIGKIIQLFMFNSKAASISSTQCCMIKLVLRDLRNLSVGTDIKCSRNISTPMLSKHKKVE